MASMVVFVIDPLLTADSSKERDMIFVVCTKANVCFIAILVADPLQTTDLREKRDVFFGVVVKPNMAPRVVHARNPLSTTKENSLFRERTPEGRSRVKCFERVHQVFVFIFLFLESEFVNAANHPAAEPLISAVSIVFGCV
jgi:hypothetical protein